MAAAAKVLREAEPDVSVEYDGTTCDSACLADDLEAEVEDSIAAGDVWAEFRLQNDYDGSRAGEAPSFEWLDAGVRVKGETLAEALDFAREFVRTRHESRFVRGYRLVRKFSVSAVKVCEDLSDKPQLGVDPGVSEPGS